MKVTFRKKIVYFFQHFLYNIFKVCLTRFTHFHQYFALCMRFRLELFVRAPLDCIEVLI